MEELYAFKPKIYSVSELNFEIRKNLETSYFDVWVEGEVSNFYLHNQRNMYFDLKDEYSKIKVVMFYENNKNLLFDIEDGLHILVNGYLTVYEKRGEYQIVALDVKPIGKGALILAFEQLKAKLEKNGYFDRVHKKEIPLLPKKIGVVTSTGGAVLRDMVFVLNRRFENFHLIVRNVNVQGVTSPDEICEALDDLCEYKVDVIIIARGGGSLEDLWAFNTEKLAEKIFNCPIPVISAVGHETDFTISDFVADVRAATPSVAAEMVIVNKQEVIKSLAQMVSKLRNMIYNKVMLGRRELSFLINRRFFKRPQTMFLRQRQELDDQSKKLKDNTRRTLERKEKRLAEARRLISKKDILGKISTLRMVTQNLSKNLVSNLKNNIISKENRLKLLLKTLQSRSPVSLLAKGFSIVYHAGYDKVIKSVDEVEENQKLRIILQDGILLSKVLSRLHKKFSLE